MSNFTPVPFVYTIGPMTPTRGGGDWEWEQNIRRAEDMAVIPLQVHHGIAVHSPQIMGRFVRDNVQYESALRMDKSILARCDAALLLPGWAKSKGSCEEIAFCDERSIPVFTSMKDLLDAYASGGIPSRFV